MVDLVYGRRWVDVSSRYRMDPRHSSAGSNADPGSLQRQQVSNPGIRYRILRKSPAGDFSESDVDSLTTSDTVRVEFTPNDSGFLSVTSGGRSVLTQTVARLGTYRTEPLTARDRELTVVFSRTGPLVVTGVSSPGARKKEVLHRSAAADGTYVVGEPSSSQVTFTISLNYK